VRGNVGRHSKHGSVVRPYVMLEVEDDWLTPAQARRFAERLIVAAKNAEAIYATRAEGVAPSEDAGEDE
jgi:hypothetical protein